MGSFSFSILVANRGEAGAKHRIRRVSIHQLICVSKLIFCRFCLNLGWLYTRLVAFNSFDGDRGLATVESIAEHANETTALLQSTPSTMNESIMEFMAMSVVLVHPSFIAFSRQCRELHLQIKLIELQGLLAQTQNEPRLKGPFPVKLYRSMLTSLQTTLDKLHSMRCVTSREEWYVTSVLTAKLTLIFL